MPARRRGATVQNIASPVPTKERGRTEEFVRCPTFDVSPAGGRTRPLLAPRTRQRQAYQTAERGPFRPCQAPAASNEFALWQTKS